ncbi:DDX20 helicase, partial [Rhinopomastus cyanomelas]|nr:DDX20 helicase [Rhinopomastus cyanomelas]
RAQHLAEVLTSRGFPAECISGSMNQNQRLDAMAKLKQFHCRVLISTDLTSRGIDAEKVNLVINLDVPVDWETYMHRIGRAGRFGTLGLSVTYCCRGEEENMMMKIAQKCNLQLLPLPEPLPAGLLDQFEDGEVEVKPVAHTGASVNSDPVCLKSEEPELQPVQTGFSEVSEHLYNLPEDNPAVVRPRKTLKQKQTKKCTNSADPDKGAGSHRTSSCPTEQRSRVNTVPRTDGQQNTQAVDEEAAKSLPRIPCLSSFKKPPENRWSFSDFVEDYDYFIKEGMEREVEIVRSYSGPGEQQELPRNGGVEWQEVQWQEVEHRAETQVNGVASGDSDGSYSSTASSITRRGTSCFETLPDPQEKRAAPTRQQHPAASRPAPEKPQRLPQNPKQNQWKKKATKQNAKQKRNHHSQSPSPSTRETEENCSCSSCEGGAPYDQRYRGYWQSYCRAWQDYYAGVCQYWRASYRQSHWMNSYSIYLQEMLK